MNGSLMSALKLSDFGGTDLVHCLHQKFGKGGYNNCGHTPTGSGVWTSFFVKIYGEIRYLWRAVDHEGEVLESYVTKRRDRNAALKFLRKTMNRFGPPHVIVTDLLRFYGVAMKVVGNAHRQETGRWLNNRAENSHLPFRRRARAMLRFRRMGSLQIFVAVHSSVHKHFNQGRHLYFRANFKLNRAAALA